MKGKDQAWTENDMRSKWSEWIGLDLLKVDYIGGKKKSTEHNELPVIVLNVKSGYYLLVGL